MSAGAKSKLQAKYSLAIAKAAGKMIHADRLIARWAEHDAHHKAAKPTSEADRLARAMIESDIDDEDIDDLEDTVDDMLEAGWDEGVDASGADAGDVDKGHRFQTLMARAAPLVTAITGSAIASVASALLSGKTATEIGDIFASSSWAAGAVTGELTAALTTGMRDGSIAQKISYVRLDASSGECDFCAGYDGRILEVDDDAGMPPLHRSCNCDITALEPDE